MKALVIIDNRKVECDVKKINLVDCELESIEVQPDKNKKGWLYVAADRVVAFNITKNDYKKIVRHWEEEEKIDFLENGLLNNFQEEVDKIMLAELLNIANSDEYQEEEYSNIAYNVVVSKIEEVLK